MLCLFAGLGSFKVMAQHCDTLIYEWEVVAGKTYDFGFYVTRSEPFDVYWGDGSMSSFAGGRNDDFLFLLKKYANSGTYRVSIIGGNPNCHIYRTQGGGGYLPVTYMDITKCPSMWALGCQHGEISRISASRATNPNLEGMEMNNNRLTLSWCDSMEKVCQYPCTVPQRLKLCTLSRGGSVDFSADLWFTKKWGAQTLTTRTVFDVIDFPETEENSLYYYLYLQYRQIDYTIPVAPNTYTEIDGVLTFYKPGRYLIRMRNNYVRGCSERSLNDTAVVFQEIVLPPATDANLFNLTVATEASLKKLTPVFDPQIFSYSTTVDYNETYAVITATSSDTNATITGDVGIQLLEVGVNTFTVTVTAEDGITTQTYTVDIHRREWDNVTDIRKEDETLRIYPNPIKGHVKIKKGQLPINEVSVYDMSGKLLQTVAVHKKSEVAIDLSHLSSGIYFLKVDGQMVKIQKE